MNGQIAYCIIQFNDWVAYEDLAVSESSSRGFDNCSNCGEKVQKSLSTRTHVCPHCGFIKDRDINAAINILQRALYIVGR
ncbi:zinc ribbon domain-containing protein, partial [Spirulina sp. CS-785/01]